MRPLTAPSSKQIDKGRGPSPGETLLGVIDIGTSKVVCLIFAASRFGDPGALRLLGLGHQRSRGLKASVVIDIDAAEEAVRAAVQQAETMAGVTLEQVCMPVSCGRLRSHNMKASAATTQGVVTAGDLDRLLSSGRRYVERDGRTLLHMNAISYRLDDAAGVPDPLDLAAQSVSGDLHAVTADSGPLRNLMQVVERCNLDVAGLTPAPFASAIAATTDAERHDGVISVDIGAGSTTLAFFADGHLVSTHASPIGGNHLTFDIARALSTPVVEAERIKTLYGTMRAAHSDEHDLVPYKIAGDPDSPLQHATKTEIRDIIAPRVDALVAMISERIETSSIAPARFGRVVLTGGGSQLVGLTDIAADLLDRPLRIGRPDAHAGWAEQLCAPAFSAACGVAKIGVDERFRSLGLAHNAPGQTGYFGQVGRWIRESF
jgi:cell division protein FtsA